MLFAAAVLCLAVTGFAQSTNSGDLRGTVTDPTGSVVPGAKVTLRQHRNRCYRRELTTNQAGIYDSVSIRPGKYRVTVTKEGFGTMVRDGITLDVGAPLSIDVAVGRRLGHPADRGNRRSCHAEDGHR